MDSAYKTELEERLAIQDQMIQDLRKELSEGKGSVEEDVIQREIDVLHDPFDKGNNPLKITGEILPNEDCEHGQILAWKSPQYRSTRTMRGWEFIRWGDKYAGKNGEGLDKYLANRPTRFQESQHLDSLVRVGDLALARIDKRIFRSRTMKAELESARQVGALSNNQKKILADGIVMTGPGLQKDKEPLVGVGRKEAPVKPDFDRLELTDPLESEE